MGIYRTYFDKNNTIIFDGKGNTINTAKNPICELSYGDKTSRFIFYCDFTKLKDLVDDKKINLDNSIKHILKIKNTSDFDMNTNLSLRNDINIGYSERSVSFDLEVRPITQFWDEGTGYDYFPSAFLGDQNYKTMPSNWIQATSTTDFVVSGAVNNHDILGNQHFDNGNENIEIDITDFINDIITTGVTVTSVYTTGGTYTGTSHNYQGFVLKYVDNLEHATGATGSVNTVGFYTKYTQTFFEPFIETRYNDLVLDDRVNFYLNKTNNLFLYVNINGNLTNLDSLPVCTISGVTQTVRQKTTGVYYVVLDANALPFDSYVEYSDTWSGLAINGRNLANVRLKFIPKDANEYYQIGSNTIDPIRYGISLSGIKREEVLSQGENRKINVLLRKPYTLNNYGFVDELFYRVYVKQGKNLVEVCDWQQIGKSYDNHFFYLDTSWMIPQTYYVDIKVEMGGEVNIYNEELKFTVNNKVII